MPGHLTLLVRAEIRHRLLVLVLLGLLAGLVGAAGTAAAAGARRSVTAGLRLAEVTAQPDASVRSFVDPEFLDDLAADPMVEQS